MDKIKLIEALEREYLVKINTHGRAAYITVPKILAGYKVELKLIKVKKYE